MVVDVGRDGKGISDFFSGEIKSLETQGHLGDGQVGPCRDGDDKDLPVALDLLDLARRRFRVGYVGKGVAAEVAEMGSTSFPRADEVVAPVELVYGGEADGTGRDTGPPSLVDDLVGRGVAVPGVAFDGFVGRRGAVDAVFLGT